MVRIRFQMAIGAVSAAQRRHMGLVCMAMEAGSGLGAPGWAETPMKAFVSSVWVLEKMNYFLVLAGQSRLFCARARARRCAVACGPWMGSSWAAFELSNRAGGQKFFFLRLQRVIEIFVSPPNLTRAK